MDHTSLPGRHCHHWRGHCMMITGSFIEFQICNKVRPFYRTPVPSWRSRAVWAQLLITMSARHRAPWPTLPPFRVETERSWLRVWTIWGFGGFGLRARSKTGCGQLYYWLISLQNQWGAGQAGSHWFGSQMHHGQGGKWRKKNTKRDHCCNAPESVNVTNQTLSGSHLQDKGHSPTSLPSKNGAQLCCNEPKFTRLHYKSIKLHVNNYLL